MSILELLKKGLYIVPEEVTLIILISNSDVCMDKIGKDINHTRHFSRWVHFVINGEKPKNAEYWLVLRRSEIDRYFN